MERVEIIIGYPEIVKAIEKHYDVSNVDIEHVIVRDTSLNIRYGDRLSIIFVCDKREVKENG